VRIYNVIVKAELHCSETSQAQLDGEPHTCILYTNIYKGYRHNEKGEPGNKQGK
jgi:hypothetical protein